MGVNKNYQKSEKITICRLSKKCGTFEKYFYLKKTHIDTVLPVGYLTCSVK